MLMSSIFSNIRKKVKQNDTKYQAVKWTTQIFQVKAEQRTGIYERPRYSIVNEDGRAVQTWKNGKNHSTPMSYFLCQRNAHDLLY
jgi:hypothetical protein